MWSRFANTASLLCLCNSITACYLRNEAALELMDLVISLLLPFPSSVQPLSFHKASFVFILWNHPQCILDDSREGTDGEKHSHPQGWACVNTWLLWFQIESDSILPIKTNSIYF